MRNVIHGRQPSLTLGLMGLDVLHLRVLATSSDDPKEKKNAQKGDLTTHKQISIVARASFADCHKFST
jgi:hypothetical protein